MLKNCDSSFLDVGIATEFLSVKLGQNGRKTIQSVKVRVHQLPPPDGYVAVCLVLTIEVYGTTVALAMAILRRMSCLV